MEVMATAVTAAQLVVNGLKIASSISELRDRIQNAPRRFAKHARLVEQLVITAKDIKNNPNLQSPAIYSFLSATLAETEAAQITLDRFLKSSRKRRYLGVINGRLERNVIEHLDNLDRTVTAFSLCISSMTSTQVELSVTRGIERVLQQPTEPAHERELVPYQPRIANPRRRNQRAKRAARKDRRLKLSSEKPTMPEPSFNRTEGSTMYSNIRIEGSTTFSVGTITDGTADGTTLTSKNTFLKIQLHDNYWFHIGDLGKSSGQNAYDGVDVVGDNDVYHVGTYSSFDIKEEDLRRKEEAMD